MNNRLERLWATKTKQDEWWSSFVTAPLAIAVNYFVVDWQWLTPNRITILSFVVAIISVVLIVIGGTSNFIMAAVLIHVSHILDCMDGQMARYRQTTSTIGSYLDRLTDQVQVTFWFGAIAYAAYVQSNSVTPAFLALIGIGFYGVRGYSKYVAIEIAMSRDAKYLTRLAEVKPPTATAGLSFGWGANIRWFLTEQRKFLDFDEGVFIFVLSLALVLNILTPTLWVFAASQICLAIYYSIQHGKQIIHGSQNKMQK